MVLEWFFVVLAGSREVLGGSGEDLMVLGKIPGGSWELWLVQDSSKEVLVDSGVVLGSSD